MKTTFEFSLPEETEEYEIYRRAPEFYSALREFREWLRKWRKHGHCFSNADQALDMMWDQFHRICVEFSNDL